MIGQGSPESKIVLVGFLNTVADWNRGVWRDWQNGYARAGKPPPISFDQVRTFKLRDSLLDEESKQIAESIYRRPGFIASLPPVAGATEALQKISQQGHRVYICTHPMTESPMRVDEIYQWFEFHPFIPECRDRIIVTDDKTLIMGDLLIDDKPEIKGTRTPVWEHVLLAQSYNEKVSGKRRVSWYNWQGVLTEL